jgi:signal transduction histidine kinase
MIAFFKNLNLRNKLILIQGTTALIAIITTCTIFVINDVKIYKQSSVSNKYSIAEIIGTNSTPALIFEDKETATKILNDLRGNPSILNAQIFDKRGNLFARFDSKGEEGFVFPTEKHLYDNETFSGNSFFVEYPIVQNKELLGRVLLRGQIEALSTIIFTYLKAAALVLFIGLLVALVISIFLQQAISNRLLSLVSKTEQVINTGNYSVRMRESGKDEISSLSKAFNTMLEQIEVMEKSLRESNINLEQRVKERTYELETANKEMESFSYSVSHDMRAPLRTINGYSKIIEKKYAHLFDEDGKEVLQTINDEAVRMGKLIDDLLAFSRLGRQDVKKTRVDMTELAEKSLGELMKSEESAEKAEIKIDRLPFAQCDANLMQQVFINLLSNAIKYSSKQNDPRIHIAAYADKRKNVYYVRDNGAGFDMKYYNKLFGVFQRLHTQEEFKGTGIGLAIVQKIILRHGGDVWAESSEGKGTTFYFSLPK